MHARKFVGTFDANCYLYLSRSMDLFDVAEHGGSLEAALARIRARADAGDRRRDGLPVPARPAGGDRHALRKAGRDVRFEVLPSIQGHDSFLVDMDRFCPVIGDFLTGV